MDSAKTVAFTTGIAGDVSCFADEDLDSAGVFTSGIAENVGCIADEDFDSAIADTFTSGIAEDISCFADEDLDSAGVFTTGIDEDVGCIADEDLDSAKTDAFTSGIAGDVSCIADEDLDSAMADTFIFGIAGDNGSNTDGDLKPFDLNEDFGLDVSESSCPNLVVDAFNPDFDEVDSCNPFVSVRDFGSGVDKDTERRTEGFNSVVPEVYFNPGFSTEAFD